MGCAWQRGSQDLRAGTSRLRLNSWLKLLTPRPQLLPLSGSWIYVFTLILLPFCRSRPLSVCLFSMTLCPPGFCLFSPHFAPYFYPPAFLYPSALLLPPTHLGLALQAGLQIPPSLRCLSVVLRPLRSREACVGGAPQSGTPCSRAGRPQAAYLTTPTLEGLRRGRPAPRARSQRIRRNTPGGPSQIRAHTQSVPHTPSTAGSSQAGAAYPRPATAGARLRANNYRRQPSDLLP